MRKARTLTLGVLLFERRISLEFIVSLRYHRWLFKITLSVISDNSEHLNPNYHSLSDVDLPPKLLHRAGR